MTIAYETIDIRNPTLQKMLLVYSFLLSGLAYLFFHYVYMPEYADIWTFYGFVIMVVPPWLIYGTHELVFYLYSKLYGLKYYYECNMQYALFVMICIVYSSFSLMLYKITHIDIRLVLPVVFIPTLMIRVMNYHQKVVSEASLSALLAMFVVTMLFVVWIYSLGGISSIRAMTGHTRDFGDTLFTIALYGLFVTLTEALPLRIGNFFAFDGYEAFKLGLVGSLIDTIILVTCSAVLIYGGFLSYFMSSIR